MIEYQAHVQDVGWTESVSDGEVAGTVGESKRLEALIVESDYNLEYKAHVQNVGWQDYVKRGEEAGTTGQSLRMEAFRIKLIDAEEGKHVWYRTHIENFGWTDYAIDGEICGSVGQALRLEAIEIRIVDESTDEDFADWFELSKKSKLGDVVFSVASGEDASLTVDITDKPIEGGNISDHAKVNPETLSIPGYMVGDDAQQRLEKLRDYARNAEVLRFVGVESANNMMITAVKTGRATNIKDGASFTVDLKEVRIGESVVTVIDEAYVYTQANDLKNGGLQAVLTE